MLKKEDCYLVGTFTKTHGVKGELIARKNSEFLEKNNWESILVDIDGGLVPFFIPENGITPRNHHSVRILIEDVNSEAKAVRFIGCDIYIPIVDAPNFDTDNDEALDIDLLIGFTYIDQEQGILGEIVDIQDYSGNILLIVDYNEQEVMIPFADENFVEVDEENRTLTMITPTGLLDME